MRRYIVTLPTLGRSGVHGRKGIMPRTCFCAGVIYEVCALMVSYMGHHLNVSIELVPKRKLQGFLSTLCIIQRLLPVYYITCLRFGGIHGYRSPYGE